METVEAVVEALRRRLEEVVGEDKAISPDEAIRQIIEARREIAAEIARVAEKVLEEKSEWKSYLAMLLLTPDFLAVQMIVRAIERGVDRMRQRWLTDIVDHPGFRDAVELVWLELKPLLRRLV